MRFNVAFIGISAGIVSLIAFTLSFISKLKKYKKHLLSLSGLAFVVFLTLFLVKIFPFLPTAVLMAVVKISFIAKSVMFKIVESAHKLLLF